MKLFRSHPVEMNRRDCQRFPPMLGFCAVSISMLAAACGRDANTPAVPPSSAASYDPAGISGARALDEISGLMLISPRDSGTPNAEKAAAHLAARLEEAGLDVKVDEFETVTPDGAMTFRNVEGYVHGTGTGMLVLGAHYDTKRGIAAGFQGANDSGSGVGTLLEVARLIGSGPVPPVDIMVVFLDGEECLRRYGRKDGLYGSRRLARKLVESRQSRDVRAVIILDMIGDRDLHVGVARKSAPFLAAAIFDAARKQGVRSLFSVADRNMIDDHEPFLAAGMPAVLMIDFEFGSAPGKNDWWHTPSDTVDKLSAQSLEIVGRVTVEVLNAVLARAVPGSGRPAAETAGRNVGRQLPDE